MQPFPHPNDATHKIWSRLANWLQRYSSSNVWNFCHSRASNSKMSRPIRPKIELDWAFMPVLVTSNFDVSGPIWPKFKLVRDFMHVLVTGKFKKDRIKSNREKVETSFSPFSVNGDFCCHGHQSFDPICLKTPCSLSPSPMMLHIKFDQDWKTCLRDIQVLKCKIFVIQGQVTPKWVVCSGPKSNSSELLYLSWLPATLMMIRSKMNELAWRHHFPIISLWYFFYTLKGS